MPQRLAGILALIVFAVCLLIGIAAENSFATTVWRALVALFWTFVIGLAIGLAARRMLQENVEAEKQKLLKESPTEVASSDR